MYLMIHLLFCFPSPCSPLPLLLQTGLFLLEACYTAVLELPFPNITLNVLSCVESCISWIPIFLFPGLIIFEAHILQYFSENECTGDKHFAYLNLSTFRPYGWFVCVRKIWVETTLLSISKVLFHGLLIPQVFIEKSNVIRPLTPFYVSYFSFLCFSGTLGLSFFSCGFCLLRSLVIHDYSLICKSEKPKGWLTVQCMWAGLVDCQVLPCYRMIRWGPSNFVDSSTKWQNPFCQYFLLALSVSPDRSDSVSCLRYSWWWCTVRRGACSACELLLNTTL